GRFEWVEGVDAAAPAPHSRSSKKGPGRVQSFQHAVTARRAPNRLPARMQNRDGRASADSGSRVRVLFEAIPNGLFALCQAGSRENVEGTVWRPHIYMCVCTSWQKKPLDAKRGKRIERTGSVGQGQASLFQ